MNSLLKEQIRTYLPEKFRFDKDLQEDFENTLAIITKYLKTI